MNNREWLYSLDVADLADWFDAEHVEHNERDERKAKAKSILNAESYKFASEPDAESYIDCGKVENDSREKLEADIRAWRGEPLTVFTAINGWLDRQAVITRREVLTHPDERDEQIAELTAKLESEKKHREYAYKEANKFIEVSGKLGKNVRLLTARVDELTAERDEWQAKAEQAELAMNAAEAMWTNADTEREQYRELLSKAIRYAHEIVNLQP